MRFLRPLFLLPAAFALLPCSVVADDLLDEVLRNDNLSAPPPAMTPPAAISPTESPAFPPAKQLLPLEMPHPSSPAPKGPVENESAVRQSPPATKPQGGSKPTFETQLLDTFAGCCFFIRPKAPEERPYSNEIPPQSEFLP